MRTEIDLNKCEHFLKANWDRCNLHKSCSVNPILLFHIYLLRLTWTGYRTLYIISIFVYCIYILQVNNWVSVTVGCVCGKIKMRLFMKPKFRTKSRFNWIKQTDGEAKNSNSTPLKFKFKGSCIVQYVWKPWLVNCRVVCLRQHGKYNIKKTKWEIAARTPRARMASVSTLFRVQLPNFHSCFYNVWEQGGGNVLYFFYKITRR